MKKKSTHTKQIPFLIPSSTSSSTRHISFPLQRLPQPLRILMILQCHRILLIFQKIQPFEHRARRDTGRRRKNILRSSRSLFRFRRRQRRRRRRCGRGLCRRGRYLVVVVDGLLCFLLLGCGGRGTRRRSVRKGAVRERGSACESLHTSSADHDDCVWVGGCVQYGEK